MVAAEGDYSYRAVTGSKTGNIVNGIFLRVVVFFSARGKSMDRFGIVAVLDEYDTPWGGIIGSGVHRSKRIFMPVWIAEYFRSTLRRSRNVAV